MQVPAEELVRGATIASSDLIATRFAARHLNITRANKALAHLAGAKRSRRRGRGVEFDEVRLYTAGDDVRAIDWRVTARSGDPHTKLFHEERERPVLVAVDLRRPMAFGSKNCFKSVLAAHVTSLLLWSALDRGERVGGLVMAGTEVSDIRPARSRKSVLGMIGEMSSRAANSIDDIELPLGDQLLQLQRIARPGSSIFIVSDWHDGLTTEALSAIRRLARQTQITAIRISDPLEQELPTSGYYAVTDGQHKSTLNTADPKLRRRYQQEFEEQTQTLTKSLQGLRIPLIELSTTDAPLRVLQRYFPAR